MSHGGGGEGQACEPNLTPLLDLVLQILMFFIVTVNFVTEKTQEPVELPNSATARPLPPAYAAEPIFVNLRRNTAGSFEVYVTGVGVMTQSDARRWVQKQYEDLHRFGDVKNPVIIRAHKGADYAQVFQLMQSCSDAGFKNLSVRAEVVARGN